MILIRDCHWKVSWSIHGSRKIVPHQFQYFLQVSTYQCNSFFAYIQTLFFFFFSTYCFFYYHTKGNYVCIRSNLYLTEIVIVKHFERLWKFFSAARKTWTVNRSHLFTNCHLQSNWMCSCRTCKGKGMKNKINNFILTLFLSFSEHWIFVACTIYHW